MLGATMSPARALADRAVRYLRENPRELGRLLRGLLGLRVGVPVAALASLAAEAEARGGPQNLTFEPVPPGFRVGADLVLMETKVRAETTIFVERIDLSEDTCRVELRLEDTRMHVLDRGETPVAALIESGALDLRKAGSLAAHLPGLKDLLAESRDNRIVVDLSRHPAFDRSVVRKAAAVVTSMVTVQRVETDEGHLDVGFRAFPRGLAGAARALREHVIRPARPWIRGMLGAGRR